MPTYSETDQSIAITSFPKSGNTWLRVIIGEMLDAKPYAKFIPDVYTDKLFENPVQIKNAPTHFLKSHAETYEMLQRETKIAPTHTIYVIRHPLDVFCSQLNYISDNVTKYARRLYDVPVRTVEDVLHGGLMRHFLNSFSLHGTLQPLFHQAGSWHRSAEHWLGRAASHGDVTVLRYEELLSQPAAALRPLCALLGVDEQKAQRAIVNSQSTTRADGKFYWKQSAGTYREFLTGDDIASYRALHGERCARLGYPI